MRKIIPQDELETKRKSRNRIFAFVVLGMLILSSVGYAFLSNPDAETVNQISNEKVQNVGDQWLVRYGDQIHYLSSSPESAKDIPVNSYLGLGDYAGKIVYLVANNQDIENEIGGNLGIYAKIQKACYGECNEDLPIKDCSSQMIIWKDSSENKVYQEDQCVFIEGDIVAVDAFLYRLLGVN